MVDGLGSGVLVWGWVLGGGLVGWGLDKVRAGEERS